VTGYCDWCMTPGPSCGVDYEASRTAEKKPCPLCRVPTGIRSLCGAPRTYLCQPPAAENYTGGIRTRVTSPQPVWLASKELAARRAGATSQPALRDALAEAGLTGGDADRAVALWNQHMRRIRFRNPHNTALEVLNGSLRHAGIPEVPAWDKAWIAPVIEGPHWQARSWLAPPDPLLLDGVDHLAAFDVNGQYLSAASSELGTGEPVLQQRPDHGVIDKPGWALITVPDTNPHGIADRIAAELPESGDTVWVPNPIVQYLDDSEAGIDVRAALYWPTHRRWLDPHVNLLRTARTALIAQRGDPAADAIRHLIGDLAHRMFGGLVRSDDYNPGPSLNHGWAHMIVATAQARMFRGLDRTRNPLVGIHADAAWFLLPRLYTKPPGLEVSDKLGKFKPAGRIPWTERLHTAWIEGDYTTIAAAMRRAG